MQSIKIAKLALLGGPGVGKDTFVQILRKRFPQISLRLIRLAEPLYEVQKFVYRSCSKEISDHVQDGILLNFLGQHMRSINPNVLLDRFAKAVQEIGDQRDLIICSDVRPIDAAFVKKLGFHIVHITANPDIALERRKRRGDFSLGSNSHITEKGILSEMYDTVISNNKSYEEYEMSVLQLLNDFLA